MVDHSCYPSPQLHFLYALLEPRHSEAGPHPCSSVPTTPSMCYFLLYEYPRISARFIVRRHRSLETLVLASGLVGKAFGYQVWSPGFHLWHCIRRAWRYKPATLALQDERRPYMCVHPWLHTIPGQPTIREAPPLRAGDGNCGDFSVGEMPAYTHVRTRV